METSWKGESRYYHSISGSRESKRSAAACGHSARRSSLAAAGGRFFRRGNSKSSLKSGGRGAGMKGGHPDQAKEKPGPAGAVSEAGSRRDSQRALGSLPIGSL
ncbi:hypothetical protein [Paenibacillus roseus]|uniref:hypothetical protein n=1 Tax=Paenibacillus sp. GCM10012307 TaxID=3317343 RepID=UPI0036D287BE